MVSRRKILALTITHGGSKVALKHGGGGGGVNLPPPLAKIQTTKAVDLKLGTLIKSLIVI